MRMHVGMLQLLNMPTMFRGQMRRRSRVGGRAQPRAATCSPGCQIS
jgi:hypothetical protein